MKQDEIEHFLDEMNDAFYAGDTSRLMSYFCLPLVVYSVAGVVVMREQEEFLMMATSYHQALQAKSVVDRRMTILSLDEPLNNRIRVTVRIVDLNDEGTPVTGSTVRYFLVANPGGFAVEMLEYIEAPLPISDIEQIIH